MIEADKDLLKMARELDEIITETTDTDLIETLCACAPAFMTHSINMITSYMLSILSNKEVEQ